MHVIYSKQTAPKSKADAVKIRGEEEIADSSSSLTPGEHNRSFHPFSSPISCSETSTACNLQTPSLLLPDKTTKGDSGSHSPPSGGQDLTSYSEMKK